MQRGTATSGLLFNKQTKRSLGSYYDKRRMLEEWRTYPFELHDKKEGNKAIFEKLRIETLRLIS
jgi:hypothetical protein